MEIMDNGYRGFSDGLAQPQPVMSLLAHCSWKFAPPGKPPGGSLSSWGNTREKTPVLVLLYCLLLYCIVLYVLPVLHFTSLDYTYYYYDYLSYLVPYRIVLYCTILPSYLHPSIHPSIIHLPPPQQIWCWRFLIFRGCSVVQPFTEAGAWLLISLTATACTP